LGRFLPDLYFTKAPKIPTMEIQQGQEETIPISLEQAEQPSDTIRVALKPDKIAKI
jgi:hypothetical protein